MPRNMSNAKATKAIRELSEQAKGRRVGPPPPPRARVVGGGLLEWENAGCDARHETVAEAFVQSNSTQSLQQSTSLLVRVRTKRAPQPVRRLLRLRLRRALARLLTPAALACVTSGGHASVTCVQPGFCRGQEASGVGVRSGAALLPWGAGRLSLAAAGC